MRASSDPAVLLSRWFGHEKPVRAFAFSNGLPWVVNSGEVTTTQQLQFWVETVMQDGPGYHDALYLSSAFEARKPAQLDAVNELYGVYIDSVKRRPEIVEQGTRFHKILRQEADMELGHLAYPIAVGHAASEHMLPLEMTLRFFLRAYTERLINSAATALSIPEKNLRLVSKNLQQHIDALARRSMNLPFKTPPTLSSGVAEKDKIASRAQ